MIFSETDFRLFRYTAVLASAITLTGLMVLVIWTLGQIISTLANLILPLAVAAVMALVLYPIMELLEQHLRLPRVLAVSLIFLVLLLGLATLVIVVVPAALTQGRAFIEDIPDMLRDWQARLEMAPPWLQDALEDATGYIDMAAMAPDLEEVTERVATYVGLVVGLAFVPLYLFFALLSGQHLKGYARELLSILSTDAQVDALYLGSVFVGYVTAFFRGQLLIALIMGSMLAIGFTLIGLQAAIIFGIVLGALNLVPFLGTIIGIATVLPVAYLQPDGGIELVLMALLVFTTVQFIESWLLTPKIMADRSGLHPAVVVISIFFWGTVLGGIIGMILAVPLSAFVIAFWRHLRYRLTSRHIIYDK